VSPPDDLIQSLKIVNGQTSIKRFERIDELPQCSRLHAGVGGLWKGAAGLIADEPVAHSLVIEGGLRG
jgi:hypothetical protein